MMYIFMSATFIKIDSTNTLKFEDELSLRTDQKSALQYSVHPRCKNLRSSRMMQKKNKTKQKGPNNGL